MSEVMNVRGDECRGDECRTILGYPSGLGKSLEHRGWISQYLPRSDGARIQGCPTLPLTDQK